jgi:hypothetical protein
LPPPKKKNAMGQGVLHLVSLENLIKKIFDEYKRINNKIGANQKKVHRCVHQQDSRFANQRKSEI